MSLLVLDKILGVFLNTLIADRMYLEYTSNFENFELKDYGHS